MAAPKGHSMSGIGIVILLYCVGLLMLVAEIFIPSHGILSIVGLGFLVTAVVKTFTYGGREAGVIAVLACLVFLPTFAYLSVKYWPRTAVGRRISPPNPVLTAEDTSVPIEEMAALIGRTGRSISPLRPVGVCEFNGKRISCVAEFGMVDADVIVEGVSLKGSNLAVVEKKA